MISIDDIGWGTYGDYAGPYFKGTPFPIAVTPTSPENLKIMSVLVATESGWAFDAINMYDSMIISVGLIQFAEAGQFSVSDMLGEVATKCGLEAVTVPLKRSLEGAGASFGRTTKGKWRFTLEDHPDGPREVSTVADQRELFLGCSGKKDAWTSGAKEKAKQWAVDVANVWASSRARDVQLEFVAKRLMWFVLPYAKNVLFDVKPDDAWKGALQAIYLSFAGNNPARAASSLEHAVKSLKSPKWSHDWCTGVVQALVFHSGVGIHPIRYNRIAPIVEKLWNVKLPKPASVLQTWVEPLVLDPVVKKPQVRATKAESIVIIEQEKVVVPAARGELAKGGFAAFLSWLFALIMAIFAGKKSDR
jgi:hypothetical protein